MVRVGDGGEGGGGVGLGDAGGRKEHERKGCGVGVPAHARGQQREHHAARCERARAMGVLRSRPSLIPPPLAHGAELCREAEEGEEQ